MNNLIKFIGIGGGLLGLNVLINKLFDEDDNETNSSSSSKTVPNSLATVKQTVQTVQPEPLKKPIAIAKENNELLNEEPIHIHREETEPSNNRSEISKYMSELGKKSGEARRKKKTNI